MNLNVNLPAGLRDIRMVSQIAVIVLNGGLTILKNTLIPMASGYTRSDFPITFSVPIWVGLREHLLTVQQEKNSCHFSILNRELIEISEFCPCCKS